MSNEDDNMTDNNHTYDEVTLLQLEHGKCRLIECSYDIKSFVPKRYTFKVAPDADIEVGMLFIDDQADRCIVVRVVDTNDDDQLIMQPGILYRWINVYLEHVNQLGVTRTTDEGIRRKLAQTRATRDLKEIAKAAGLFNDDAAKCIESGDDK